MVLVNQMPTLKIS